MTIASKTTLVQMRFVSCGEPFINVTTRSDIDTSGISAFVSLGNTFLGVSNETTNTYPSTEQPVRLGVPYRDVTTRADWDASFGQGRVYLGEPFRAKFAGTSSYPTMVPSPVWMGEPFRDVVSKESINAEGHDYFRMGAPFWVRYTGAPPPFNTARFFLFF